LLEPGAEPEELLVLDMWKKLEEGSVRAFIQPIKQSVFRVVSLLLF
jgi:hypothetical protein